MLRLVAGVLCKDNTRTLHKLIKAQVTGEQVTASGNGNRLPLATLPPSPLSVATLSLHVPQSATDLDNKRFFCVL